MPFHTATEAFRTGKDTPRDYLERCLHTISDREPTVRAWAALNEDGAREQADRSSARWRDGTPLSPIDGLPIGIKDLLETKDMPTQMGCEAYTGNFPARDNAAVWALRAAGAVIVGKTVTAELGGSHPGPTTNPFDPARTPGGSSSGSAAAVGAGMVPAAIGTQVGGSIIRPASYCGNWALKPSQGAINRGERQTTSMSTHGVHATCAEDMWLIAVAIATRAGGDPGHAPLSGPATPPRHTGPSPWESWKPKVGPVWTPPPARHSKSSSTAWPPPVCPCCGAPATRPSSASNRSLSGSATSRRPSRPGRTSGGCVIWWPGTRTA
ncbi:amidase [Actinomadura madurae]|uniref:amidase family protein n=1 Tax=Actinomadura madurae TaxID=1993 RepID=UPI0020272CC9|nr:amidase [Actinomadura madurae]URN01153.1 amidase [Actinomadura madurae]